MTSLARLGRRERNTVAGRPLEEMRSECTSEELALIGAAGIEIAGTRRVTKAEIVSFYARSGINATLRILRAWYNRRTVRQLLDMDDRQLSDIGLYRSDVHDALSVGMSEDPSMELTRRRLQRRGNERAQRAEARSAISDWSPPRR